MRIKLICDGVHLIDKSNNSFESSFSISDTDSLVKGLTGGFSIIQKGHPYEVGEFYIMSIEPIAAE